MNMRRMRMSSSPYNRCASAGCPFAPGPAEFLVVGFDTGRQIDVADEADIGFVDPHAEGDGGDHHRRRLGHEDVLIGITR